MILKLINCPGAHGLCGFRMDLVKLQACTRRLVDESTIVQF